MNTARIYRTPLLIVATLILLLGVFGCEHKEHKEHHLGKLLATTPLKTNTEITRDYVAQLHAYQHIEIRALEQGYLQDIFIDEGQTVTKGTKLFQIMPMIYQAEVKTNQAEAKFAEIEYQNTKSLRDSNIVSANELALSQAKLDKANAEVNLAKAHLNLTDLRAPFDGIINRLEARKGSLLEEGELLTTLSDNSKMWVYFNVTEAEYLDYKMEHKNNDTPVKLMMANHKIFDQEGKIETIEADFDPETGNIAFRATFPNPDGLLRHGETGKVLMTTQLKDVLIIPQKATFEVLDKKFVYVVDEKDVLHARQITIAHEIPHLYIISEGLAEGDKILVEGLRKVRDGQHVELNLQEPQAVIDKLDVPAE